MIEKCLEKYEITECDILSEGPARFLNNKISIIDNIRYPLLWTALNMESARRVPELPKF